MPKYLVEATYSDEGLIGLAADGAAKRLRDVKAAAKSLGGKVEAFYFSFGDSDAIGIADFPDNASVAAFSMLATSAGTASVRTTPLLTIEEADQAIGKLAKAKYRAPGGGQ
ncbi:MAG: GYD domain-containing protein [Acidobacteria bacterium]|nr:GYD domain-containing protein [Acidobacteriota bacterium]MDA1234415.1 GYD domain-containing protein [Acidobacteriota bacterium]